MIVLLLSGLLCSNLYLCVELSLTIAAHRALKGLLFASGRTAAPQMDNHGRRFGVQITQHALQAAQVFRCGADDQLAAIGLN